MPYVRREPVGRRGLVDVVLVVVRIGAALRGLPLAAAHRAALHHAAGHLGRWLLRRRLVGVAVLRHHPGDSDKPNTAVKIPPGSGRQSVREFGGGRGETEVRKD